MKRASLSLFLLAAATAALAQRAATYDASRRIHLEGPVTRVAWTNPRAFVFVNVSDATGTVANWGLDIGNPLDLERSGWLWDSVKVGDIVAADAYPARGQERMAYATAVMRGGMRLFTAADRGNAAKGPAPRWPNGHVRLGPEPGPDPGKKGYWGRATVAGMSENPVEMDADGLLKNLGDIDQVAPFLPWSRAVYEFRQRNLLADDPAARCLPTGGPRQFHTPHGFQFIEQPELGRILVLMGGGNRNWRVIHTDGRPQGAPDELVLTYYGNSVGRWEGDTLVVDSIGFNEGFWMSAGGLPHTEALHLVERISRPDLGTLRYEVTVEDLRTYSRPWTAAWTIEWVDGEEIQEYFCEEANEEK